LVLTSFGVSSYDHVVIDDDVWQSGEQAGDRITDRLDDRFDGQRLNGQRLDLV
jgi:hypothetical protein